MRSASGEQLAEPASEYPPGIAYSDGRYGPISEAKISVLDWGFLRSDATYDVVHVWRRRFFRLELHLDRFFRSVERLRLTLPFDRAALAENRFIAFAIPFGWVADEEQRRRGLHIAVSSVRRIPPEAVDPTIKNYHWLDLVNGLFEAYDRGAENVVLVDLDGNIAEGPGFNLFAVKDGRATTPARGVLEGITRRTALELCAELEVPTVKAALPVDALRAADEVFITSTAGGIMPLTRVDGAPIGDGRPGPVTRRLSDLYWAKHDDPAWTTPVD
jgi:branched-chain amino acid aminotransferase